MLKDKINVELEKLQHQQKILGDVEDFNTDELEENNNDDEENNNNSDIVTVSVLSTL